MPKSKIVFLVSTLGRTGPTSQLYNLVSFIDRFEFEVTVITLSQEPSASRWNEFHKLGIDVLCLNSGRFTSFLTARRRLLYFVHSIKPDIIHSQGIRADYLNSRLKGVVKTRIATQRNNPSIDYQMLFGRITGLFLSRIHLYSLSRIPNVVTCSSALSKDNKAFGLSTRYIHNGVDNNKGQRLVSNKDKTDSRRKLQLPIHRKLFIWIAPFIPRKMAEVAISAFLKLDSPDAGQLCMLGDGPTLNKCKRLANRSPNIVFRGHVDNVDDYLMAADVFVSSSYSEGLPNSVLEALAWGIPTILSDIPAHREILEIDSKSGVMYPVGESNALVESILNFSFTYESKVAAQNIVTQHLNSRVMAKHYQNLYKQIS